MSLGIGVPGAGATTATQSAFPWGAAISGLGMLTQGLRSGTQHRRNRELMNLQFGNQQKLNEQGRRIQMQMWKDTNYPAQIKMLEEAGLNPGLLYGMGGAGGATTGSQGGGSASANQSHAPMDIGAIAQVGLMKSQKEVNESIAKKNDAEANKISGVDTDEGRSRISLNAKQQELWDKNMAEIQSNIEKNAQDILKSKSDVEVNDTIKTLNNSIKDLNDKNKLKAIKETKLIQEDLDWMKENGLNRNDSMIGKTIKYLSNETGYETKTIIGIMGGYFGLKALSDLIPNKLWDKILDKPTKPVKGYRPYSSGIYDD